MAGGGPMSRILIASRAFDEHGISLCLALQARGHEVIRWIGADFPSRQRISLRIGPSGEPGLRMEGAGLEVQALAVDTVWYRRPSLPVSPDDWLHPADRPAARREAELFLRAIPYCVPPTARWVNPLDVRQRASNKIVQLEAARQVGLRILPTLFSNDPAEIRAFIAESPGPVIYKTFYPMRWQESERMLKVATRPVSLDTLPSDRLLQAVPGIYQHRVSKAFELRVCCMGQTCFAMRIDSQADDASVEDFRAVSMHQLRTSPFALPPAVREQCLALMASLGLVFGSLDLLVDHDGQLIFLEVNEQGQFLWMEQLCPELPMLDAMCEFLANPVPAFLYQAQGPRARFDELLASGAVDEQMAMDRQTHVFEPDAGLAEAAPEAARAGR